MVNLDRTLIYGESGYSLGKPIRIKILPTAIIFLFLREGWQRKAHSGAKRNEDL
jgi:hypothetical protein